jgi:hypothetical protein
MTEVPVAEVPVLKDDYHPIIGCLMSFVGGIFSGHQPVVKEVVPPEEDVTSPVPIKKVVEPSEPVVVPQILTGTERAEAIERNREETRRVMEGIGGDLQRQLDFFDGNPCISKEEDA